MFYIKKCANCNRSGSVALKADDTLCNLCSVAPKKEKPQEKEEDKE